MSEPQTGGTKDGREYDIAVVGTVNTDFMARGARLPLSGESLDGDQFMMCPGGKGANQALAAARLNARVALVASVGDDDRGDEALATLSTEGVDLSYVVRRTGTATGAVVVQIDAAGQKQILAIDYANALLDAATIHAADVIRQTKVVLVPASIPLDIVLAAIRVARESGAKVFLDPARPQPLPDEILAHAWAIKPNRREAQALTGIPVTDRNSARKAGHMLLARGVRVASVEAGDSGNLIVWNDGEVWLPRFPVSSVDATGAGDAFMAALAVAFVNGESWEEAGWFASATAALTTTALGAQSALPRRPDVLKLISAYRHRLSSSAG